MLNIRKMRHGLRKGLAVLLCLSIFAPIAGPALAWKPKTHVYLAEQAMRDATDNGKVTIYQTEYATGRLVGVLGEFEANPQIVAALRANPAQYLAGVVGPDAYPDLMTGQQIIHPGTNLNLLGSPQHNEPASQPGADAWLTHLWRLAYGRKDPNLERLRAAMNAGPFGEIAPPTDTPQIRAFVAGYLTHAAGDMFMHTFVNHYTGGDFAIQPEPRNAVKHIVLEGYVGKRTPATRAETSIDGVDDFIYRYMVRARPGSLLEERLLRGAGTKTSVPAIFSTLRNGLQRDVDKYDRERLDRRGPSRVAYAAANGPAAEYKRAWIEDIDRGLRAWPRVAHEISLALVYNPHGDGADIARAKEVASAYVSDHLLSMAGGPDAVIATAQFIKSVIESIMPTFLQEALAPLQRQLLEWLIKEATGMSVDEIKEYLNHPETQFDPVMNSPGGGYGGRSETRVTLAEFNRSVLRIDDPGARFMDRKFEIDRFAPAFNTVQMTKLLFLSEKGMEDLLSALRAKGLTAPDMPTAPGAYENAMLGFLTSMDGDNRWQGLAAGSTDLHGRAFFLARGGADAWRALFMRQIGEREDWPANTAPAENALAAPDDAGFEPIDWWAVRLDDVKYDNDGGINVAVTLTFRNDTSHELSFSDRIATPVRTLLNVGPAGRSTPLRMEYVHGDGASLPQWHYPAQGLIPPKGRVSVRFVYQIGESVRQRLVHSVSVIEQRPGGLAPLRMVDGPSKQIELPKLNLDGTVGAPSPPPALPDIVTDVAQLKKYEGLYRTSLRTHLTLALVGDELIGEAMSIQRPSPREYVKLKLYADGTMRGDMRDPSGQNMLSWHRLTLTFAPDAQSFSGDITPAYGEGKYTGERIGAPGDDPNRKILPNGFVEAGHLALRLDGVRTTPSGPAVTLTARNHEGGRRGIQYYENTLVLIASDGTELGSDGNFYGATISDRLSHTIWLEEGDEGQVTYLFPAPAGRTPVRLSVRDGTKEVASLDLAPTAAPQARTAAAVGTGAAMGQPVALGRFEATLDRLVRGVDGDWEALITLRNLGAGAQRLLTTDLNVTLYGADGQARNMNGNFYDPASETRRTIPGGMTVAPGEPVRLRILFPQSSSITPTRYRFRERNGDPQTGTIPPDMLPRP